MYHNKKIQDVLRELDSSSKGLTEKEAEIRLKKYGKNIIEEKYKISKLKILINQFKNFIIYILIFAALISFLFSKWVDAVIITAILILNAMFGFFQEYKAEKSIKALIKLTEPEVVVIRNNKEKRILASELVPGDILLIEGGSKISADARIISSASLRVDESTLTGESSPVDKKAEKLDSEEIPISDQINMVFAGTMAVYGRAKAVVVETGMNTELGKIAESIQKSPSTLTPLQERLKSLGIKITGAIIVLVAVIFLIGYIRFQNLIELFLASVSLVVAAVPEGLPAVITITLALGTQRMLKKNSLIRKLSAVEALGSVDVICADKTGTLTKNEMEAKEIYMNKNAYKVEKINKDSLREIKKILEISYLCNNATENYATPTERALLNLVKDTQLKFDYPRKDEIPFDSEKKYMVTVNKVDDKEIAYMKGAPEIVLEHCKYIYKSGRISWMSSSEKKLILSKAEEMADSALRVLGFAYSKTSKPESMVFTGLIGLRDPPREGVKESIELCKKAGIRPIMITGDHKLTAEAVASEIGIEGKTLTGKDLNKLTLSQLKSMIEDVSIFARVTPKHKIKIVEALRKKGHIISMTGDGVNDAPALKKSDIGVAVGSGTDVAKEASQMIILDDHFKSIVDAVKEGRRIFLNIKKFVLYLFSSNLGELLTVFIALLFAPFLPLLAVHILWINLVTDGLPALALGIDPVSRDVMNKPPRKKNEGILKKSDLFNIIFMGLIMSMGTLILFKLYLPKSLEYAQTMAFTTLVFFQMFNVLNFRADKKTIFSKQFYQNKYLLGAISISIILQICLIYLVPNFFHLVVLGLFDWVLVLLVSSSVLLFQEIRKLIIPYEF